MSTKKTILDNAKNNIKSGNVKTVLYHVLTPISDEQFATIKNAGYFNQSNDALGGQSNGYYYFTTRDGADYHIKTTRDAWDVSDGKHAYLVETTVDANTIKYPEWKLDYEATQDFLFDLIYDCAQKHTIKFDGTEIQALDGKKLSVSQNGKFSRIKGFNANDHSGIVEKIADFLYRKDPDFKQSYDNLLHDMVFGRGEHSELFAIKTTQKHPITKITRLENNEPAHATTKTISQTDKFFARYGKSH